MECAVEIKDHSGKWLKPSVKGGGSQFTFTTLHLMQGVVSVGSMGSIKAKDSRKE